MIVVLPAPLRPVNQMQTPASVTWSALPAPGGRAARGTGGPDWLQAEYRANWVKQIEQRFPTLKGRVSTMMIEGGVAKGSFKNPVVANEVRGRLLSMLDLPSR